MLRNYEFATMDLFDALESRLSSERNGRRAFKIPSPSPILALCRPGIPRSSTRR